jgi:hypothetical protein
MADKDINKMKMLILSTATMALEYKKNHHASDDAVIEYIVKNSDELINNL